MRSAREWCISEDGSALFETAVTMTVLLMMVYGIIDFTRALYTGVYLGYAARQGAHYAMVRGSSWGVPCVTINDVDCTATSANVHDYVRTSMVSAVGTSSGLAVTTTWPGTTPAGNGCSVVNSPNQAGCVVQVQVSFDYAFLLPLLPRNVLHLQSRSAVIISE